MASRILCIRDHRNTVPMFDKTIDVGWRIGTFTTWIMNVKDEEMLQKLIGELRVEYGDFQIDDERVTVKE